MTIALARILERLVRAKTRHEIRDLLPELELYIHEQNAVNITPRETYWWEQRRSWLYANIAAIRAMYDI